MELIKFSYEISDFGTVQGSKAYVRYMLKDPSAASLENFNGMIETLSQVFLYVGIGVAVFAALMLLNYISVSIANKKREIGILRAVGAKSADVFSIFFSEAVIIVLIAALIAAIGAGLVVSLALANALPINISIFNYGIRQIALIIGISLVTALVSSFLPIFGLARKKPIETIRNN
ncbi:hypothetical protein FACS1894211_16900 [Clostridia bacterium]|nr:hypothetical protein FACS1894211_16900 [Clostridia bacterium]